MKRYIYNSEDIMCMSDVRGRKIKVESNVPFSFYYSAKNSSHGPRVKVAFNPDKLRIDQTGTLKLCDDWSFKSNTGERVSSNMMYAMKKFFRKYLVLFLLVWESKVEDEPSLGDYLEGDISFEEFIKMFDFYDEYSEELDSMYNVEELEEFCREHNLVNFYGN